MELLGERFETTDDLWALTTVDGFEKERKKMEELVKQKQSLTR